MMKHILYCLGFFLIVSACGPENIVQDARIRLARPEQRLTMEKDSTFDEKFPQTLHIGDIFMANDSVMLLYDMSASGSGGYFYKAYSAEDYSYMGEFLREGRGPGEVLSPDLCATFRTSQDAKTRCYIFEKMLYQSFSIDLSETIDSKVSIMKKISELPVNTLYARPYRDSLQFVINIENDNLISHIIDTNAEKLKTFRLYPEDISAERYLPQLGNNVLINENLVALVMLAIPQINFLNLETGAVNSVAVDRKYKDWRNILAAATDIPMYMKSIQYYNNAESTADYIMALYLDKKRDDIVKGRSGPSPHIHIFDWEGNFLYALQIDENISRIAYDSGRKFMYGLDTDEGRIYRYDLSGLL